MSAEESDRTHGARLLVVDDEPWLLSNYEQGFGDANIPGVFTSSGMEAKHRLLTGSYAVAVVDFQLPDLDGLTVVEQMRAQGINTHVLLVTGLATEGLRREIAQKFTGVELLPKTTPFEEIVMCVQKHMKDK